ncbi:MAG TPA: diguanylate cyclase [Usitatibacteraceae bacterium]|nr:diguanylate cyclase [Usitatibacteraceae bacterium]
MLNFWIRAIAALQIALYAGAVQGLPLDRALGDFMLQEWSVDDGLPHSTVRAMAQTRDGYIWFGTPDGLVQFDGLKFKAPEGFDAVAERGAGVLALLASRDGGLYVSLRGGGILKGSRGRFTRLDTPGSGISATAMMELPSGELYAGLEDGAIVRFAGGAGVAVMVRPATQSGAVVAFVLRQGDMWVGTKRGLSIIRNAQSIDAPTATWLDKAAISALAVDRAGALWAATSDHGLVHWDGSRLIEYGQAQGLPSENLSAVLEDRDGGIWVGAIDGIYRRAKERFERFTANDGLRNSNIRGLLEDDEGGVWLATDRGASRFRDALIRTFGARQGIKEEFVRAVLEDRSGQLWVGTADGLFVRNRGLTRRFGSEHGFASANVLALAEGVDGTVWAGTHGGRLYRIRSGRAEAVAAESSALQTPIRAIDASQTGQLWIATATGLVRLDLAGKPPQVLGTREGLPSEQVSTLLRDRQGILWIGTRTGIARLASDGALARPEGLRDVVNVLSLNADSAGNIWATLANGVAWIDGGAANPRMRRLGAAAGLEEQNYFSAIRDDVGDLWLCSNRGIVRLAGPALDQWIRGGSNTVELRRYGRSDGMLTAQCNGASAPAGWKTRAGQILFPTAQGLAVVDPQAKARAKPQPPRVHINGLTADGLPVAEILAPGLSMDAGTRRIQVSYSGISFSHADQLRYRYRLVGLDEQWVDAVDNLQATFTQLPPGEYRFEVQAGFEGSGFSGAAAALEFKQLPRFFETWWFRIGLLAGLALLAAAILRYRVSHLEAQRRLLRETVTARTRELEEEKRKVEAVSNERARLLMQVAESARAYERLSKEDSLTAMPNRRELERFANFEFARAVRTGRPLAIALGDVDHFKLINDRHSHAAGDETLRHVARVLKEGCRTIDMVGRFGGEEFLLVLPETTREGARLTCERLREAVEALVLPVEGMKVTISFGFAIYDNDATWEQMLRRADAFLYQAKQSGRNCVRG